MKFFTMTQTQQRQQREEEDEEERKRVAVKSAEKRVMEWLPTPGGNGGSAPKHAATPDTIPANDDDDDDDADAAPAATTNNNTDGVFSQNEESLSGSEQQNVRTVLQYDDDDASGPRDNNVDAATDADMVLYGDVRKALCDIDNVLKRQRDNDDDDDDDDDGDDDDITNIDMRGCENLRCAGKNELAYKKSEHMPDMTNRTAPVHFEMTEMERELATATCAFCGKTESECSAGRMIAVPVEKTARKKKKKKATKAKKTTGTSSTAAEDAHEAQQEEEEKYIYVHEMCALFSPQCYEDAAGNVMNVEKELRRSKTLKCHVCGGAHASLGCYKDSCKKSFHYPCAMTCAGVIVDAMNFAVACTACRKALPGRSAVVPSGNDGDHICVRVSGDTSPNPPSQKATTTAAEPRNRNSEATAVAAAAAEKKKKKKQRAGSARDTLDAATTPRTGALEDDSDDIRVTSRQPGGASKADYTDNPNISSDGIECWTDIIFSTSGLDTIQRERVERLARATKCRISSSVVNATHLIVGIDATRRVKRTAKYLTAIVCGATIVGFDWVDALLAHPLESDHEKPAFLPPGKYPVVGDTQGGRLDRRAAREAVQPFASVDVAIMSSSSTSMVQNSNFYTTIRSLLELGGARIVTDIDESTKCLIADGTTWSRDWNEDGNDDGSDGKIPVVSLNWVMDHVGSPHAQLFHKNVITRISRSRARALMAL